jgi:hypothetical protein
MLISFRIREDFWKRVIPPVSTVTRQIIHHSSAEKYQM